VKADATMGATLCHKLTKKLQLLGLTYYDNICDSSSIKTMRSSQSLSACYAGYCYLIPRSLCLARFGWETKCARVVDEGDLGCGAKRSMEGKSKAAVQLSIFFLA